MKKIIIGSIMIVGLAVGLAYAHGNGWGGGYGGHMMGMMGPGYGGHMMDSRYGGHMVGSGGSYDCPGAARFGEGGWDSKEHQKFLEDTVDMRKNLNDKRFEYREAQRNPDTTRDQLAALQKEVYGIEQQLREKSQQY